MRRRLSAFWLCLILAVTLVAPAAAHADPPATTGTPWAWGYNHYGVLANGSYGDTSHAVPVRITSLSQIAGLAAGYGHYLAVDAGGRVFAWGGNWAGQIGNGETSGIPVTTPVQVAGLTDVAAVAGSPYHSLALKSDGTVWAWGVNWSGQLGDGTNLNRPTPVQVAGLSGVTALAAGEDHSLALKSDGTVWAWGGGGVGQLGHGIMECDLPEQLDGCTYSTVPVQTLTTTGMRRVTAIAAGWYVSLALRAAALLAWDPNDDRVTDIGDVAAVGLRWLQTGAPAWIIEDVNGDGVIDIGDVAVLGAHWQETW